MAWLPALECMTFVHLLDVDRQAWQMSLRDNPSGWLEIRVSINEGNNIITTSEIAARIAYHHGLTRAQAKTVVEAVFAAVTAAALVGDETSIPWFGKFKVKHSAEREARNPGTGATIKVLAAKKLSLTPAKAL